MSFKTRIILYTLLPLMFISGAMVFLTNYQFELLSSVQSQTFRDSLLKTKKREITNYVELAKSAIQPTLDTPGIDENIALNQVKKVLNNLKYDKKGGDYDGYFFVYDKDGVNLVHPALKGVVGKNLHDEKNKEGDYVIQRLLKSANKNENRGFLDDYLWHRPSANVEQKKTSYVVKLEPWGWVLGTGFYHGDILQEVTRVEKQVKSNIRETFYMVLAYLTLSLTIFGIVLLGLYEKRLAEQLRELTRKPNSTPPEIAQAHKENIRKKPASHTINFTLEGEDLLTTQEIKVLECIDQCLADQGIADKLDISKKTVEKHKCNMRRKLKFKNPHKLTRYAFEYCTKNGSSIK